MDHASRRARLEECFDRLGIASLLVSRIPNVRYLTGFAGSNGQLILTAGGGVFLTDGRYTTQAEREVQGLDRQTYASGMADAVAGAAAGLGGDRVGFEADALSFKAHADLVAAGLELVPTTGLIETLRSIKDAEELALIQAAQDMTDQAFASVTAKLSEGMTEKQVAFELEAAMRGAGADGLAFDTIVGFGAGAAEPHHHPTDHPLAPGDLVKMDFGALAQGYHSDMTRTVAFGEPGTRAREVYEVVRLAQRAGVGAVRAGAVAGEVDAAARSVIEDAGFGDAFTHGLGHGVGLEIHEAPALRRNGVDLLAAGMVVTVEPGVYVAGALGVRIEDMVEVTAGDPRVVAAAPKEILVL